MMKTKQIFSIPNILSFLRIGLIPFILWTFFANRVWLSAGLIIFSGITDVLDGYIARHYNMVTPLGQALDPIADKLTLFSIIVALCFVLDVVIVVLAFFVIKEVIMGIESFIILKKTGITYSSKWHGKVTTFFLYFTMITHVVWVTIPETLSIIFLAICTILMITTLILYTIKNAKILKNLKNKIEN